MIITKTPFRISFFGGGTDFKEFYEKEEGAVLSTTINKGVYNILNYNPIIRVSHSQGTEIVNSVDEIKHRLIKACLKFMKIETGVQIDSQSPLRGTGLGSSSSYAVGLLNALHSLKGEIVSAEILAREACIVERKILGEPGGKQDQYMAAHGGFRFIEFMPDETVKLEYLFFNKEELLKNLMLFNTGVTRDSVLIQSEVRKKLEENREILRKMREFAYEAKNLLKSSRFDEFGRLLHKNWELKKKISLLASTEVLNSQYQKAIDAGALGGKILGAGGGGFFLFYVPEQKQEKVRNALNNLKEVKFDFEPLGSRIVYVD